MAIHDWLLTQDTFLLNEKVKNNIALGIDDNLIKSDILLEAMQKSNSYEFIKIYPKKKKQLLEVKEMDYQEGRNKE